MISIPWRTGSFSLRRRVHTGSGAHPASSSMGAGGSFPGAKAAKGVKLTTHLHPVRLNGVVLS
jgi:hypothetical protein